MSRVQLLGLSQLGSSKENSLRPCDADKPALPIFSRRLHGFQAQLCSSLVLCSLGAKLRRGGRLPDRQRRRFTEASRASSQPGRHKPAPLPCAAAPGQNRRVEALLTCQTPEADVPPRQPARAARRYRRPVPPPQLCAPHKLGLLNPLQEACTTRFWVACTALSG